MAVRSHNLIGDLGKEKRHLAVSLGIGVVAVHPTRSVQFGQAPYPARVKAKRGDER